MNDDPNEKDDMPNLNIVQPPEMTPGQQKMLDGMDATFDDDDFVDKFKIQHQKALKQNQPK